MPIPKDQPSDKENQLLEDVCAYMEVMENLSFFSDMGMSDEEIEAKRVDVMKAIGKSLAAYGRYYSRDADGLFTIA